MSCAYNSRNRICGLFFCLRCGYRHISKAHYYTITVYLITSPVTAVPHVQMRVHRAEQITDEPGTDAFFQCVGAMIGKVPRTSFLSFAMHPPRQQEKRFPRCREQDPPRLKTESPTRNIF